MIRRLSALPLAFAAVLILAATVAAGGWATATLDPGTTGPQAGTPVTLGFRVLQHGQTPNSTLNVVVHAAGAAGGSVVADATHQGESVTTSRRSPSRPTARGRSPGRPSSTWPARPPS